MQLHIKCRYYRIPRISECDMVGLLYGVIVFEFLWWWKNETVVKFLCVASSITSETFRFKRHYMADLGSTENSIN